MGLYVTDWERRDLRRQRLMLGVSTCREYLGELAKSRREAVRS